MNIVPFLPEHLKGLIPQAQQSYIPDDYAEALRGTPAYSVVENGKTYIVAGIVEHWPGRAIAWAMLDREAGSRMLAATRAVRRFLDGCGVRRVEMAVDCDFPAAHRWARLLGFHMECERMQAYTPEGRDCALYVRIR